VRQVQALKEKLRDGWNPLSDRWRIRCTYDRLTISSRLTIPELCVLENGTFRKKTLNVFNAEKGVIGFNKSLKKSTNFNVQRSCLPGYRQVKSTSYRSTPTIQFSSCNLLIMNMSSTLDKMSNIPYTICQGNFTSYRNSG
jgi:hypothetical protein